MDTYNLYNTYNICTKVEVVRCTAAILSAEVETNCDANFIISSGWKHQNNSKVGLSFFSHYWAQSKTSHKWYSVSLQGERKKGLHHVNV